MNFNYKRNLVSRSTLASSFTGSIYTFKYGHLVEPGVEGQKLPHRVRGDLSQLAACIELVNISFEEVCDVAKVGMIHHAN